MMGRLPQSPQIDVVMPIYNAEHFVEQAVRSILSQTMSDFRLVCIDDGSVDGTAKILSDLANQDSRIEIIRQNNQGLVGALNVGLAHCRAPLIARMDADDIAMPERFELQSRFLQSYPEVVAVGTAILELDSDGEVLGVSRLANDHFSIDQNMLRMKTGMAHPTVMMRREVVVAVGGYRPEYEWIEDLDLWLRMAEVGRLANLPDVLLCYRQHTSSGSWSVGQVRRDRTLSLMNDVYRRRQLNFPIELARKCQATRSPSGPNKWARKASQNGQWEVAVKHLRRQWQSQPTSLLTMRISAEVVVRLIASAVQRERPHIPEVPRYSKVG